MWPFKIFPRWPCLPYCLWGLLGDQQKPVFLLRTRPQPASWGLEPASVPSTQEPSQTHRPPPSLLSGPGLSLQTPCHLSACSGAIGPMGAFRRGPAVSTISVMPVLLVVRWVYQGMGVAHNPTENEIRSNFVFLQGHCQVTPEQTKFPLSSLSFSLLRAWSPPGDPGVSGFPSSALCLLKKRKAGYVFGHGVLEGSNHGRISMKSLSKFSSSFISQKLWSSLALLPSCHLWTVWGGGYDGRGRARTRIHSWALQLRGKRMLVHSFCKEFSLNSVGFAFQPKHVVLVLLGKLLCTLHADAYFALIIFLIMRESRGSFMCPVGEHGAWCPVLPLPVQM